MTKIKETSNTNREVEISTFLYERMNNIDVLEGLTMSSSAFHLSCKTLAIHFEDVARRTDEIRKQMKRLFAGYEINSHISELNKISGECITWSNKLNKFLMDERNQGVVDYIGQHVDQSAISSTASRIDEYTSEYFNIAQQISKILENGNATMAATQQRLNDKDACEEVLNAKEEILREQAANTYNAMQEIERTEEYMNSVNNKILISPLVNYRELYDADHAEFAYEIAHDENIKQKDAEEFIRNILTCGIIDNDKEHGWLEKKLLRYSKDFDNFIAILFRYCQHKSYKWAKTVHLIYQWMLENKKAIKGTKGKFYYYMIERFPDGACKFKSFTSNSTLDPDEKNDVFAAFDVLATVHMPVA